jgi:dihydroorotate dehydrogenase
MTLSFLYPLLRSGLMCLDAETAHALTLKALRMPLPLGSGIIEHEKLKMILWDRVFPNPVGLAAGFDKNAESIQGLFKIGFGFLEVGTVTPRPQEGNPRPRVFRGAKNYAVINRMGFPNEGVARFKENFSHYLSQKPRPKGLVGINIGMNKDQTDPAKDYCDLIRTIGSMADYLTINISSPNTPGLRNLQDPEFLRPLLQMILDERTKSCGSSFPPPILVKLAPDLSEDQLEKIAETLVNSKIDGVILTNTTLLRPDYLPENFSAERGGLSGRPLKDLSTATIRRFYALTHGKIPIIGVGGIESGEDAYDKICAGASLVQLYTGLIYHGPDLIGHINRKLLDLCARDGYDHISQAVGRDH